VDVAYIIIIVVVCHYYYMYNLYCYIFSMYHNIAITFPYFQMLTRPL